MQIALDELEYFFGLLLLPLLRVTERMDFSIMKPINLTFLLLVLFVRCTPVEDEEEYESIGTVESALENPNALNPNALNPNALNPNALNPNALNPNALNPNALNPNALAALKDPGPSGDLSRQLIKYVVGCALDPSQSFRFSWTDNSGQVHEET